jgi:signal transduction histidine kinase
VDDLLVVARSDIGTLALSRDKLDLRAEVDSVTSALRRSLESKSVSVVGSGSAWGDPLRVRQIIRNLVSNAVRYGGSTIEIAVHETDTECCIRVHDDGVGIPEASIEMVFDAYTRAHNVPTQPGSVGIGLAVSRRLARMMGGDVIYDGAASSAFELRLPKAFDFVGS